MEREILFRGKSVDNEDWIYGVSLQYCDGDWQIIGGKGGASIASTVVYETIGQYTGLTDENGKKIFEGDIIDLSGYMGKDIGVVKFGEYKDNDMTDRYPCGHVGFYVDVVEKYRKSNYARKDILFFIPKCEVISNIHDNPKLLEGRRK